MSLLAMAPPSHHAAFQGDFSWDRSRSVNHSTSSAASGSIALPSIRQLFAEIETAQPKSSGQPVENKSSHTAGYFPPSTSEYVHSAVGKRRRTSHDKEDEPTRPRQMPRLHGSPDSATKRLNSPGYSSQPVSAEAWAIPSCRSPFTGPSGSSAAAHMSARERTGALSPHSNLPPGSRELSQDDRHNPRHGPSQGFANNMDPPSDGRLHSYPFSQHHHSRYQSLSTGSAHPYDRTPFTAGGYTTPYQEVGSYAEVGGMGYGGDSKQRKRRGNLPKETTDKLRAWFVAHLQHPYPTEDEKQELMRQTGLQMNQISNWFINARRRQLPAMISNARAESEMIHGRVTDSKSLSATERGHYRSEEGKRDRGPLTDDSGFFEEDAEGFRQRASVSVKRGSV